MNKLKVLLNEDTEPSVRRARADSVLNVREEAIGPASLLLRWFVADSVKKIRVCDWKSRRSRLPWER